MPTIPLVLPAEGDQAGINHGRVAATMLWPSAADENHRNAIIEALWKQLVINFARANPDLPIGSDGAEALERIRRGPAREEIMERAKPRYYEGILVGTIVLQALSHHQRTGGPVHLSDIKQNVLKHYGPLKLSGSALRNLDNHIWPRMKPVAHFWAAHMRLGLNHGDLTPAFPCPVAELPKFLIDAEALLNEASQIKLRRSRATLLDPGSARTVHSTIVSSR